MKAPETGHHAYEIWVFEGIAAGMMVHNRGYRAYSFLQKCRHDAWKWW